MGTDKRLEKAKFGPVVKRESDVFSAKGLINLGNQILMLTYMCITNYLIIFKNELCRFCYYD